MDNPRRPESVHSLDAPLLDTKSRRTTLLSVRNHYQQPGFGVFFEFEELIAEAEGIPITRLTQDHRSSTSRAIRRSRRLLPDPLHRALGHAFPVWELTGSSELIFLVCPNIFELGALERLRGLQSDTLVAAYIPEVWPVQIAAATPALRSVERLDHAFTSIYSAVQPLERILNCPVTYIPLATDVARFARAGPSTARPIRLLNLGRRDPNVHAMLRAASISEDWSYWFDTANALQISDFAEHRTILAERMGLCSAAISNFAKFDRPEIIENHRELSSRLFEGLASGTVLIGDPPESELLRNANLQIEDLFIPAGIDDAVAILGALNKISRRSFDPARRAAIAHAASSHDWSHRWETILSALGLPPAPRSQKRTKKLNRIIARLE